MKPTEVFAPVVARRWLPWGAFVPVLAVVFVVASQLVGVGSLGRFVTLDAQDNPVDIPGLVGFLWLPFALLAAMVLLWVRFGEGRSFASIGLAGDRPGRAFLRGLALGVASIVVIVAGIVLLRGETRSGDARSLPAAIGYALLLLPGFALQSSAEELLFRGWVLSGVAKKLNLATGIVVSAGLFALLHFDPAVPWLFNLTTMLFSVFACALALRSGSALGAMGWHSGWNWMLAVGFGLPVTGIKVGIPPLLVGLQPSGATWLTGGAEGPEGSIVTVAFLIVAIGWQAARIVRAKRARAAAAGPREA